MQEILSGAYEGVELAGGSVLSADLDDMKDCGYFVTDDADVLFEKADVVIDFTSPTISAQHAWLASKHGTAFVLATTGLSAADEKDVEEAAKDAPIVYSANYSIAVNILQVLTEKTASILGPEFDIEIVEAHHKHKIDAPSGTALMIGKAAAEARGVKFDKVAVLSREGETGPRREGEIGFSTIRGGDVVGEHTVYFLGDGERLELKQQAMDRSLYAKGAIRAAMWAVKQKAGLYSMKDVLGL